MADTREELFIKYYNPAKIYVSEMTRDQLREHIEQLENIALEAKANLHAARDEERERNAKLKNNQKEWLVNTDSDNSQAHTDAIQAVKTRKARMSKADQLRDQLEKAGIDEDTIKTLVKNIERRATEKDMKTITFNVPSTEIAAVKVKVAKPENVTPFDPSKLFGKKENNNV